MERDMFHYMQPNIGHSQQHLWVPVSNIILLNRRVIMTVDIMMTVVVAQY